MAPETAEKKAAQEEEDDDYDPFATAPAESVKKEASKEKAAAKAAPAAGGGADEEAPWTKKAPWRKKRGGAAKAAGALQLPAGPKIQAVPFDPDNLAASVQAITRESRKILEKAGKKIKEGQLKNAPWRTGQQPQAPPPKAPRQAWHAAPMWWTAQQAPWRRSQQAPAPPPSKAGKAVMSKATGMKANRMGAGAKSKAVGMVNNKAAGVRATKMAAMAKSKAKAGGVWLRPGLQPPPPKAGAKAFAKAPAKMPWWAKQAAHQRQFQVKAARKLDPAAEAAKAAAETAKNFLARPNNKRLNDAAAAAQEYFKHSDAPTAEGGPPAPKKSKMVVAPAFAPELLEKAPSVLQTCRSLLEFLDKKCASLTKPAVEMDIAVDLRVRLGQYADLGGRLAGLRRPGGWDARAKRVFDLGALLGSEECKAALALAEERREKAGQGLEKELLERGLNDKGLEELSKERSAWADDQTRREWIAWCARIARAKEAELIAAGEGKPAPAAATKPENRLTAVGVVEAMLNGRLAGS